MQDNPIAFVWPVDRNGYDIVEKRVDRETAVLLGKDSAEFLVPRGGPLRNYWPLEDDSLWLCFAESCKDAESVLAFARDFGHFDAAINGLYDRLDQILETADRLRKIWSYLQARDRYAATLLFSRSGLPTMREAILWYAEEPERFQYRFIPLSLRDALLHQAGEAITGNRHFRRCRNEGCSNWFRLGPALDEGGRRSTVTARREFCSDRCRVASARRQKKEATAHA